MSDRSDEPARTGSIEVGVRRVPELDFDAPLPAADPRLVERIGSEIRRSGPMTFARFMDLALYDPEAGYYTAGEPGEPGGATGPQGPGRRGDFLTAPESHPIFGWAIARHLESVWDRLGRPARFVVREHGAGAGALAVGILDGLRRSGSEMLDAVRYQATDVAPARLDALRSRLDRDGLGEFLEPEDGEPAPGAILANELLDAMPVHRVEGAPGGAILERFVTLAPPSVVGSAALAPAASSSSSAVGSDSPASAAADASRQLTTVLGAPSTPALAARLGAERIVLEPGQPAEICLAIDGWIAQATAALDRGTLLLIDYGAPAADLYAPARGSTLRAYHRHRVHADPFVAIGRQDLTTHVDLTAVERAARAAGLASIGRARQADFLAALGLGELLVGLQSDPSTTLESYLAARSAVVRMLDPRATGAFAVLAFGRGLAPDPPLAGFATTSW